MHFLFVFVWNCIVATYICILSQVSRHISCHMSILRVWKICRCRYLVFLFVCFCFFHVHSRVYAKATDDWKRIPPLWMLSLWMVKHKVHIANSRRGLDMIYGNRKHLNANIILMYISVAVFLFLSFTRHHWRALRFVFVSLSLVWQKAISSVVMRVHFNIKSKVHIQRPPFFFFVRGCCCWCSRHSISYMLLNIFYLLSHVFAQCLGVVHVSTMHLKCAKDCYQESKRKKTHEKSVFFSMVKQRNSKLLKESARWTT